MYLPTKLWVLAALTWDWDCLRVLHRCSRHFHGGSGESSSKPDPQPFFPPSWYWNRCPRVFWILSLIQLWHKLSFTLAVAFRINPSECWHHYCLVGFLLKNSAIPLPRPCTVYQDKKELRVGNYISIKFCSGPGMFCKRKESDARKHCALFLLLLLLLRENVGSGHHFCYLLQVRVTKLHRNTQRTPTCIKNVKMLKDYCLPIIDIYIPYIWWHCKWILKLIFWSLNLVNEHIHIGFIKRSIVWPIKETSPNVFWNAIFSFSKEHYTARINILS